MIVADADLVEQAVAYARQHGVEVDAELLDGIVAQVRAEFPPILIRAWIDGRATSPS